MTTPQSTPSLAKTMSNEQAREIDFDVAERVMGWTRLKPPFCNDGYRAIQWYGPKQPPGSPIVGDFPCDDARVPRYSTEIAADYSVLLRVRETFTPEQRRAFRTFLIHTWSGRLPRIPQTTGQTVPTYDIGDFEDQCLVGDYSKAALSALGDKEVSNE